MSTRTSTRSMDEAVREAQKAMKEVSRRSEAICAAGFGLCAIGNLLGADASEHHMTDDLTHGLANAVLAIGELLKDTGNQLWEISEEDQQ